MSVNMPGDEAAEKAAKRRVTFYLPPDLISAVNEAAIERGRGVTAGRAFNPSAVVEDAVRAYLQAPRKG